MKSAPRTKAKLVNSAGTTPIIERLAVSNVMTRQIDGSIIFVISMVAAISSFDDLVSIHNILPPSIARAIACSRNVETELPWSTALMVRATC